MTDIAELGFAVNTAGLKDGSSELDRFKGKAKEVEDQVKKTDAATAKAGDGAKKLGDDSKAASAGVEQITKSSGAAEAAAKRLGISVEEYGKRTQATKAAIAGANTATQAVAPAMNAAATASQAAAAAAQTVTAATRSTAPAMAAAATSARTMAAAKDAAVVSSANLAAGLNTLRPAVIAAGGAMGTLPAVAAAAKFGIAGVATALAGGLVVSLAKSADAADNSRARLGAMFNSADEGRKTVDQLRAITDRGGVGFDDLAKAVERATRGLGSFKPEPGVIRIGDNAIAAKDKVVAAFAEIDRVLRTTHTPGEGIKKAFDDISQSIEKTRTLTGDTFAKIRQDAPTLARALTSAFMGADASLDAMQQRLQRQPATVDEITNRLRGFDAAASKAFDPTRAQTLDESFRQMGRSWDRVVQSLAGTGAFTAVNEGLSALANGLDVISGKADFWSKAMPVATAKVNAAMAELSANFTAEIEKMSAADDSWAVSFADATKSIADSAATYVGQAIDWIKSLANAMVSSPAPGGGTVPTISDTGNVAAPNAYGNAFAGGRVTPFARGTIVTKPTLFAMADGMGLMGEAGPEAVMPLARGPDGKLGVTATGGARVPVDPFVDIELALEDQTTEFRNALTANADAIGGDITKSAADIIKAIEAGNILLKNFAGSTAPSSGGSVGVFGSAVGGFDNAVQTFGESVNAASGGLPTSSLQVGSGEGRHISGESLLAPPGAISSRRESLVVSSSSGGGTNAFTDFGWNRNAFYTGEAMGGGSGASRSPVFVLPSGGGVRSTSGGGYAEANPGGYYGQYIPPQVVPNADIYGSYGREIGGGSIMPTGVMNDVDYLSNLRAGNMPSAGWMPEYSVWQAYQDYGGAAGDYYAGNPTNTSLGTGYYAGAFAQGGSFVVPGAGGTDSVRTIMDITPGERVTVDRPGTSGGGEINIGGIHLHGITRPNEWLENTAAIEARAAQAVSKALEDR